MDLARYSWVTKALALVCTLSLTLSTASARIVFQNDNEFQMESDNLVIDSDANGGNGSVYVKFNNSGTAADNGFITWDITNRKFSVGNIDLTGTVTATGQVNASGAAGFRMRESATVTSATNCTTANELILNTTNQSIYMCTVPTPTNTWVKVSAAATVSSAASDPTCNAGATGNLFYNTTAARLKYCDGSTWQLIGPQDFEQVFAADADKTLTTGNQNFTVNTGTANFNATNTGQINFNTGALGLTATTSMNITAPTLGISGTNVSVTSGNWNITTGGVATFVTANTTNLTNSGGAVNFSGATSVRTRQVSAIASAACTVVGDIVLDTTTNKLYSCTATGTPGTFKLQGGGGKVDQLVFDPEYPGGIVDEATGTSANKGTLTTVASAGRQFYKWITTKAAIQDVNLRVKFVLPEDFRTFGTFLLDYQTNSATAANNNVDITIRDVTVPASPVTCATVTNLASATWTTNTIAASTLTTGCPAAVAGNTLEAIINLASINASNFAQVGQAKLNYNN